MKIKQYFVPNDPRQSPREVIATKVGSKWVYGEHRMRWDAQTGKVDGGKHSSPGRVFSSKNAYEAWLRRQEAWKDFVGRLTMTCPDHISMVDIEAMRHKVFFR